MSGMLRAQFNATGQITMLEIAATDHTELVPRSNLENNATASPEVKQSPNMNRKQGKGGAQQGKGKATTVLLKEIQQLAPIPPPSTNAFGITNKVLSFFEVW